MLLGIWDVHLFKINSDWDRDLCIYVYGEYIILSILWLAKYTSARGFNS